jgi:hypothetical protein
MSAKDCDVTNPMTTNPAADVREMFGFYRAAETYRRTLTTKKRRSETLLRNEGASK